MKTLLVVSTAIAAFLVGAYSDNSVMSAEREWCTEIAYTAKLVTPADVYECAKYGITLDGIITPQ